MSGFFIVPPSPSGRSRVAFSGGEMIPPMSAGRQFTAARSTFRHLAALCSIFPPSERPSGFVNPRATERALTQRYIQQIADQETRLETIQHETADLTSKREQAQATLDTMVSSLTLETTL
jgi:hypothetical protein